MEPLYRIISFPGFVNLIEMKADRFVQPTKWEDTYEGYMLRLLENRSKCKEVLRLLYEKVFPDDIGLVVSAYMNLWSARWMCYGQCWTKTPESDALWRIYAYDKMAVRIESDEDKIRSMVEKSGESKRYTMKVRDVDYELDKGDDLKTQIELLRKSRDTTDPFFHKRSVFSHEKEKRIILVDNSKKVLDGLSAQGVVFNYGKANEGKNLANDDMLNEIEKEIMKMQYPFEKEEMNTERFIPVSDLTQYITSVMVHPQAEDWIVKLVEKICERVHINYLGKSHMYDKLV